MMIQSSWPSITLLATKLDVGSGSGAYTVENGNVRRVVFFANVAIVIQITDIVSEADFLLVYTNMIPVDSLNP